MMIAIRHETLLTLAQAAALLPPNRRGRPVCLSCLYRWIQHGIRTSSAATVRLEALRLGGRWLTSAEALERFARRLTPAADLLPGPQAEGTTQP